MEFPNPLHVFIQALIFFSVLVALTQLVFKPVLAILEERRRRMSGDREEARELVERAQQRIQQYEAQIDQAKTEAKAIKADILKEAGKREREILNAAREEAAARRWEARAALAERKEALDLAAAARQRQAQHQRRAQSYRAESARHYAHIVALKAALLQPGPAPSPPVVVLEGADPVAQRLAALEREDQLERDLAELKRQLGRP